MQVLQSGLMCFLYVVNIIFEELFSLQLRGGHQIYRALAHVLLEIQVNINLPMVSKLSVIYNCSD